MFGFGGTIASDRLVQKAKMDSLILLIPCVIINVVQLKKKMPKICCFGVTDDNLFSEDDEGCLNVIN